MFHEKTAQNSLKISYSGPTDDNGAPSLGDLARGVDFIGEIDGGGRVFIHCWEGIGRSATTAAAYFVSRGSTPVEAWKRIKKIRPFIRPTKTQVERLNEYSEIHL